MIKIIKDDQLWMEEEAIQQLHRYASLYNIIDAVALPDLHSGNVPIGTTYTTTDIIYPFLIGNDIGCGMSLFQTTIKSKKLDKEAYAKRLENTSIEGQYSIGGGNHFGEILTIDKIIDKEEASYLDLNKNLLYLLIHSGSRSMGAEIFSQYHNENGYPIDSLEAQAYLTLHQKACDFAKENREGVAKRLLELLHCKTEVHQIIDCMHNGIEYHDGYYYHHKGSISAFHPYAIIAGSRGSYSYVVKCIPTKETLYSISHGAGRKWPRHTCKGRLQSKYKRQELIRSSIGSITITNKKELLYEEASEAYKNIEHVIRILEEAGCIKVIARLKPEVTYKC